MSHSPAQHTGTLYVLATPIGNLADMTTRAVDVLNRVALVACEDTRTSGRLMQHFGINTPLTAYHEHNETQKTDQLIDKLSQGASIALISDAGTPLVSDPGFRLTQAAHNAGIPVSPVVGACAAVAALSVSGLASDRFYFHGFLPNKASQRKALLGDLAQRSETLIFYESPHRVQACLADMVATLGGDRMACFCRELTKTFETVKRASLAELYSLVANDANQQKGEVVLVVSGNRHGKNIDLQNAEKLLKKLMQELPPNKAAALTSELTGVKKKVLYELGLQIKHKN